jgi:hypothetical protein
MSAKLDIWTSNDDVKEVVSKWSAAIKAEDIDGFLRDAQMNVKLLLPAALYSAIDSMVTTTYLAWSRTKTYAGDDEVLFEDRLFVSKTSHSNSKPPNATNWDETELWSVWRDYIKPYILYSAAAKYVILADKWLSQEGTSRVINAVRDPLTPEEVAMMGNTYQNMADRYFLAFKKYMDDNEQTIDAVDYTAVASDDVVTFKPKTRIRVV